MIMSMLLRSCFYVVARCESDRQGCESAFEHEHEHALLLLLLSPSPTSTYTPPFFDDSFRKYDYHNESQYLLKSH